MMLMKRAPAAVLRSQLTWILDKHLVAPDFDWHVGFLYTPRWLFAGLVY